MKKCVTNNRLKNVEGETSQHKEKPVFQQNFIYKDKWQDDLDVLTLLLAACSGIPSSQTQVSIILAFLQGGLGKTTSQMSANV